MKCLVSKGHYYSLSRGIYPLQNHNDYALALYFKNDPNIKSFCSISVHDISGNFILQLNQKQYLLLIEQSPIYGRSPENTENKIVLPPLAVINLPRSSSIFSTDFMSAVNSFTSKLPITLWGYQFDPFLNKSGPYLISK